MEESDEEMVTSSEPNVRAKKRKKKRKGVAGMMPMMPVLVMNPYVNMEPGQMPMFRPGKSGQVPYQYAFTQMAMQQPSSRGTKRTKRKAQVKNSKGHTVSFNSEVSLSPESSSTNLQPHSSKMLTFSSLRVKKSKTAGDVVTPTVGGSFTGHASMNVRTVTKKTVVKGIMKKSTSESSTESKN